MYCSALTKDLQRATVIEVDVTSEPRRRFCKLCVGKLLDELVKQSKALPPQWLTNNYLLQRYNEESSDSDVERYNLNKDDKNGSSDDGELLLEARDRTGQSNPSTTSRPSDEEIAEARRIERETRRAEWQDYGRDPRQVDENGNSHPDHDKFVRERKSVNR